MTATRKTPFMNWYLRAARNLGYIGEQLMYDYEKVFNAGRRFERRRKK